MAWLAGFRGQHVAVSNASGQNSEAPTSPIASALFKYAPLNEVVLSAPAGMNRQQAEKSHGPPCTIFHFPDIAALRCN